MYACVYSCVCVHVYLYFVDDTLQSLRILKASGRSTWLYIGQSCQIGSEAVTCTTAS